MAKEIPSLQEVLVDQLKDLYSAETLIAKALPKLAKAATSPDLKNGFKLHLEQTKEHVVRIKSICETLQVRPTGKTCQATVGLVKEGEEAIEEDALPEMKDLMLIAAATLAKASGPAVSKAMAAEKSPAASKKSEPAEEVGKAIKKVVKKIAG